MLSYYCKKTIKNYTNTGSLTWKARGRSNQQQIWTPITWKRAAACTILLCHLTFHLAHSWGVFGIWISKRTCEEKKRGKTKKFYIINFPYVIKLRLSFTPQVAEEIQNPKPKHAIIKSETKHYKWHLSQPQNWSS